MGERKNSRSGLETRDRIIDAALETVRTEGLVGTSARAIARTGEFNQALVFYHFGSVEELLLAALRRANERRITLYAARLAAVESLGGLVAVANDLHNTDSESDHLALSAIVAGWSARSDLGPSIVEILRPWDEMVGAAVDRCLAGTSFAGVAPTRDVAYAVSALFLGIGLFSRLEADGGSRTRSLFGSIAMAAAAADTLLQTEAASGADGSHQVPGADD